METNRIDGNFVNFLAPIQIQQQMMRGMGKFPSEYIGVLVKVNFKQDEAFVLIVCVFI